MAAYTLPSRRWSSVKDSQQTQISMTLAQQNTYGWLMRELQCSMLEAKQKSNSLPGLILSTPSSAISSPALEATLLSIWRQEALAIIAPPCGSRSNLRWHPLGRAPHLCPCADRQALRAHGVDTSCRTASRESSTSRGVVIAKEAGLPPALRPEGGGWNTKM